MRFAILFGILISAQASRQKRDASDENCGTTYKVIIVNGNAKIQIGTPPQTFDVTLDTGSPGLWIASSQCTTGTCIFAETNKFDCSSSSTCTQTQKSDSISYAIGGVTGTVAHDIVCIGPFCTNSTQRFINANEFTASPDGTLGLGRFQKDDSTLQPLDFFFSDPNCAEPIFGVFFNRTDRTGELTLCGTDTTRYEGDLEWFEMIEGSFWEMSADSITVGGKVISQTTENYLFFDTGSTRNHFPAALMDEFAAAIGATPSTDDPFYRVKCSVVNTLPDLKINVQGRSIVMHASDYVWRPSNEEDVDCRLSIVKWGGSIQLAEPFLSSFYLAHDRKNDRLGLARIAY